MKELLTKLLCFLLLFTACKKEDDNNSPQSVQSPFTGNWSGTFVGADNCGNMDGGWWTGNISASGVLTGAGLSIAEGNLEGVGTVTNSGVLNASFINGITSNGATFSGNFYTDTAYGTWVHTTYDFSGTWNGQKD